MTDATRAAAPRRWARIALVSAAAAAACALASTVLTVLFLIELSAVGATWLPWAVNLVLASPLMVAAVAASLRSRGALSSRRYALVVSSSVVGGAAGLAVVVTWSAGFDAVDAGRPTHPLEGEIIVAGLLIAWLCIATALALLGHAAWRRSHLDPAARRTLAVLAGLVGPPVAGATVLLPIGALLLAGGALAVVLLDRGRAAVTP
ncbi:hypothetical protein CLV46_3213 [Diaminobutyricimonas aerilata]|uniref:Uncharacterized protein n=1 Tax=Diaminobutyricimonas aerilata TaxID=1162967 RepID=A0A2M9CP08_9MICO|nr:hypothetical protein [Diaminobutyricimonas aerilata]PJJ73619.1 hypothetical protein CLV46_3213 [Diaminobutyricimonas aerilata]